jgi:hypothetical protein
VGAYLRKSLSKKSWDEKPPVLILLEMEVSLLSTIERFFR